MTRLCIFIVLLATASTTIQADSPSTKDEIVLGEISSNFDINHHVDILEDKQGTLTAEQVLAPEYASRFKRNTNHSLNFGFTESAYWIRFTLQNGAKIAMAMRYLRLNWPVLHSVLYQEYDQDHSLTRSIQTGALFPFNTRDIKTENLVFAIHLRPGEKKSFLIRIESAGIMALGMKLQNEDQFLEARNLETIFLSLAYGSLITLTFLYGAITLIGRGQSYQNLVYFIISYLIFRAAGHGYAFRYFWPDTPEVNLYLPSISASIALIMLLNLITKFSPKTKTINWQYRIHYVLISILSGLILLTLFSPFLIMPATALVSILVLLFCIYSATCNLKNRLLSAKVFLIAIALFASAQLLPVLSLFGWMPNGKTLDNLALISAVIAVILFGLGQAHRARIFRQQQLIKAGEYKSLVDHVDTMFCTTTWDGQILFPNKKFANTMGYKRHELIGKSFFDLIYHKDSGIVRETFLAQLATMHHVEFGADAYFSGTFRMQSNNNDLIAVEAKYNIYQEEGGIQRIFCVLTDKTSALAMQKVKADLMSTVSHELKTPLTSIIGYLELLRARSEMPEPNRAEIIGIVKNRAEFLNNIVDDLLDLDRIATGRQLVLNREVFDLIQVTQKVADFYRMDGKDIALTLDYNQKEIYINADRNRLEQVINNLFSNAIKFSPGKRDIKITINTEDKFVNFSMSDKGIGVAPELLDELTRKFYRVDTSSTAPEGLGLGLSITKQLVNLHGGTLSFESEPGKGFTAKIILPLL